MDIIFCNMPNHLFCILVLFCTVIADSYHKYCIVGSGPAGLQLGYFLHQNSRDYIIYEKGSSAGTFFEKYPRHDKLLSINKIYTGQMNTEFNFRHDWNSLISHDKSLKFSRFSKDLYPHRKDLLRYLKAYQKKLNIKVQFNTTISNVRKVNSLFLMDDQLHNQYSCSILILATGLSKPNIPEVEGVELALTYQNMSIDPEDYAGKSVFIIGTGNAAMETAANIDGRANYITIGSKDGIRLAWATHYVGDIRAVNNEVLDNYQLKSLDGVLNFKLTRKMLRKTAAGKIALISGGLGETFHQYDTVILCTGWLFDYDLLNKSLISDSHIRRNKKYPKIKSDYSFEEMKNLYLAGTATHSLDWRKSAGGFIHGFRYTVRALSRILENRYEGRVWTTKTFPLTALVDHFTRRMNEASGTYQMFANLGDIAIINHNRTSYQFVEEFPVSMLPELSTLAGVKVEGSVIVSVFEYGRNFSGVGKDPFHPHRATTSVTRAHKSNFLHPIYYHFEELPTIAEQEMKHIFDVLPKPTRIHHTIEDFFTNFKDRRRHVEPLIHFVEHATGNDLSQYDEEKCLVLALTSINLPLGCREDPLNPIISKAL